MLKKIEITKCLERNFFQHTYICCRISLLWNAFRTCSKWNFYSIRCHAAWDKTFWKCLERNFCKIFVTCLRKMQHAWKLLQARLSAAQRAALHQHQQDLLERTLRAEEAPRRQVTVLLKARVTDLSVMDFCGASSALLTIWSPAEDVADFVREGATLRLFGATAITGGTFSLYCVLWGLVRALFCYCWGFLKCKCPFYVIGVLGCM